MTLEMRDYENRMKGRDEGLKQGLKQGLEQGLEQGRRENAASDRLTVYLFSKGLTDEVLKAAEDPSYKVQLLEKYQAELE